MTDASPDLRNHLESAKVDLPSKTGDRKTFKPGIMVLPIRDHSLSHTAMTTSVNRPSARTWLTARVHSIQRCSIRTQRLTLPEIQEVLALMVRVNIT